MDLIEILLYGFLAFLIGIIILCGIGYYSHYTSIPKGCAEVPIPDTCHNELRPIMCGKIVIMQTVEVCDRVIVCYNGAVLSE